MGKIEEVKVAFLKKVICDDSVEFVLGNEARLKVRLADYAPDIVQRLALHGLSQKIGDAVANLAKGREYDLAYDAMEEVHEALRDGEWNKGRQGNFADLIAAMAKLKKLPLEDVAKVVQAADEAKRKEWMGNKAVQAEIAEMVAARKKLASASIGVDDLDFELPE